MESVNSREGKLTAVAHSRANVSCLGLVLVRPPEGSRCTLGWSAVVIVVVVVVAPLSRQLIDRRRTDDTLPHASCSVPLQVFYCTNFLPV